MFGALWAFVSEDNNRKLVSWIAGGVIAIGGGIISVSTFLSQPSPVTFEQIRGLAVETEDKETISSFSIIDDSICEEDHEFGLPSPANMNFIGCSTSDIILDSSSAFPQHFLDVSIRNNQERPLLVTSVTLKITAAEQRWHPPAGDGVEIVKPKTHVVLRSQETMLADVKFDPCSDSDLSRIEAAAGDSRVTMETYYEYWPGVDPETGETVEVKEEENRCLTVLSFNNGKFLIEPIPDELCDYPPCRLGIAEFSLRQPFSFKGELLDPVDVPPGKILRFTLELENYVNFPNQMYGTIDINDGEYSSPNIFLFRWDSGRIWFTPKSE